LLYKYILSLFVDVRKSVPYNIAILKGVICMQRMTNPTQARKDLYKIIKSVNENSTPIEINGRTEEDSAVIMSAKDYKSLQETLYLANDGTLDKVHKAMKDDSGDIDITNGVDWNNI